MTALLWLIPIALCLGASGLLAFVWSIKNGQFDDTQGDAYRILTDEDQPLPETGSQL